MVAGLLAFSIAAYAETVVELGKPTGFVNDYAHVLNSDSKSRLTAICDELNDTNGTELAIVTIKTTGGRSIENFAQELFESWGIGKEGTNNGVLILIAVNDRKWRVLTGYGVEGALTDTLAKRIMENEAVGEFHNG
ncbi:MAG: TPM domain-containing protein, partial [bacterium]